MHQYPEAVRINLLFDFQKKYTKGQCFFVAPIKRCEIYREFPILPRKSFFWILQITKNIKYTELSYNNLKV